MIKYNITNKLISGVHDLFSDNAHVPTEYTDMPKLELISSQRGNYFPLETRSIRKAYNYWYVRKFGPFLSWGILGLLRIIKHNQIGHFKQMGN